MIKPKNDGKHTVPLGKRDPSFTDSDKMPFGIHKGKLLQDVPAQYLVWLHSQGDTPNIQLNNYIFNNWLALQKELPESKQTIY